MALAATTASSQAAIVQITLVGNKISSLGGNSLNADLTGDAIDDVEIFVASVNAGGRVRVGAYHLGWVTCQGGPNYRAQPRFSSSGLIPGFGDPFVEGESPLSAYGLNCIIQIPRPIGFGKAGLWSGEIATRRSRRGAERLVSGRKRSGHQERRPDCRLFFIGQEKSNRGWTQMDVKEDRRTLKWRTWGSGVPWERRRLVGIANGRPTKEPEPTPG
jgi:hypothetical protein